MSPGGPSSRRRAVRATRACLWLLALVATPTTTRAGSPTTAVTAPTTTRVGSPTSTSAAQTTSGPLEPQCDDQPSTPPARPARAGRPHAGAWTAERGGFLVSVEAGRCAGPRRTTIVTAARDGGRVTTDTIARPCAAGPARTCVHTVTPTVVLVVHAFAAPTGGTELRLRVLDLARGRRVQAIDWSNDGGPASALLRLERRGDAPPELVLRHAESDAITRRLVWDGARFTAAR